MRTMSCTRARAVILLCVVAGIFFSASTRASEVRDDHRAVAFTHATVIPMDRERLLVDHTVVVADGRIEKIGPAGDIDVPPGTILVNAQGRYLLPAFCDMHTHVLGEAWNILLPPADRAAAELDMESFLFPYIANGVTLIQVLSATPDHIGLRERIARGELLGPRLILAHMIDGPDRAWPPPLSTWVATPEEARLAVLEAADAGYDAMKIYSFLNPASYEVIVSTALEKGMDVIGHIPMAVPVERVLASGQRLVAHSEEFMKHAGGDFSDENARRMATVVLESDTWVVPTLVTSRSILLVHEDAAREFARPEARYFQHPMQQGVWSFITNNLYATIPEDQWRVIRTGFEQFQVPFVGELNRREGRLLAGTDTPLPSLVPGFALHRELEELVDAGLTPFEALRTSTTNPFEYLDESERAGTIEAGKLANLVLLKENPLADIANSRTVDGVMLQGKWISGDQIRDRLEQIASTDGRTTATQADD